MVFSGKRIKQKVQSLSKEKDEYFITVILSNVIFLITLKLSISNATLSFRGRYVVYSVYSFVNQCTEALMEKFIFDRNGVTLRKQELRSIVSSFK